MIEVGAQIDDCFDEFQVLKGEIKKLIKEAEEIIEGINNLQGVQMKRTKRQNKEILNVVSLAKEYVNAGYKYGQAIDMAQRDIRKQEIEKYEKQ